MLGQERRADQAMHSDVPPTPQADLRLPQARCPSRVPGTVVGAIAELAGGHLTRRRAAPSLVVGVHGIGLAGAPPDGRPGMWLHRRRGLDADQPRSPVMAPTNAGVCTTRSRSSMIGSHSRCWICRRASGCARVWRSRQQMRATPPRRVSAPSGSPPWALALPHLRPLTRPAAASAAAVADMSSTTIWLTPRPMTQPA
jgi:hypothetical protein